ncbi:response regulator [Pseudomonas soli]|jgi:two-component system OmpR family response regulator|uniref:Response regulator n=1 Tax=Pseudomonas soli TaxID=1306993 RepID=A0AAJ5MHA9_9PSED|nr:MULTISPECIES: response regulator [Pseudomonas]AUY36860.1 DNA-binding response regulator [Pseudomonas sp. PONIH3]MDT3715157.1 response regulator [Pseudomonas soli]MDT3731570.1 response regulator [Pseudomonas soli]MDW9403286.1 response regulator [Pseudomonas soli]MEE1879662.1 response regulator [Pseudomonas soli]
MVLDTPFIRTCTTVSRLLIVDDDVEILALLKQFFVQQGYEVDLAAEGQAMWAAIERQRPDAIILDLMLPGEGGLSLCQKLRAQVGVPVIMLTAMAELSDRIIGLELGADDYLTKPFDPRELLARLRAVQRRVGEQASRGEAARPVIGFAGWHLDVTCRELRSPEQVMIPLSGAEFDLLVVFLEHPQRILTREQLIDLTRGQGHDAYDRSIDVQVSRLRRKIEPDSKRPDLIRTVRNGGYLFTAKVSRS